MSGIKSEFIWIIHGLHYLFSSSGTTLFKSKSRLNLDSDMFGLEFDPVRPVDVGRYMCLINNRPKPDAIIKMNVLGEC